PGRRRGNERTPAPAGRSKPAAAGRSPRWSVKSNVSATAASGYATEHFPIREPMKSKRRSRWIPVLVLALGAAAAVVAATRPWALASQAEAASPVTVAAAEPAIDVEVAAVRHRLMRDEISAVGTLRAAESVMLRPEIAGRIDRIHFRDGQAVRAGDLLVSLDATVIGAEVEQARAELDLARSNVRRTRELANQRFVSARSLDEAESSMRVLEAKLKLAQARLGKT